MDDTQGIYEKLEALKKLNRRRFDYVLARSRLSSVTAALDEIGLSSGWFYKFTEAERDELETLAEELHYEEAIQARMILAQAVNDAAAIKVAALQSKDRRLQQDAATEILDRVLGKALQPTDITSKGDKIVVRLAND